MDLSIVRSTGHFCWGLSIGISQFRTRVCKLGRLSNKLSVKLEIPRINPRDSTYQPYQSFFHVWNQRCRSPPHKLVNKLVKYTVTYAPCSSTCGPQKKPMDFQSYLRPIFLALWCTSTKNETVWKRHHSNKKSSEIPISIHEVSYIYNKESQNRPCTLCTTIQCINLYALLGYFEISSQWYISSSNTFKFFWKKRFPTMKWSFIPYAGFQKRGTRRVLIHL